MQGWPMAGHAEFLFRVSIWSVLVFQDFFHASHFLLNSHPYPPYFCISISHWKFTLNLWCNCECRDEMIWEKKAFTNTKNSYRHTHTHVSLLFKNTPILSLHQNRKLNCAFVPASSRNIFTNILLVWILCWSFANYFRKQRIYH
jgi:hypothetical protein